jgi:hypothetical protein
MPSLVAGAVPDVKHGVQAIFLRVDHDAVMEAEAGSVVLVDRVQLVRASECGGGRLGQFQLGASLVANVGAQDHVVWVLIWIWVFNLKSAVVVNSNNFKPVYAVKNFKTNNN